MWFTVFCVFGPNEYKRANYVISLLLCFWSIEYYSCYPVNPPRVSLTYVRVKLSFEFSLQLHVVLYNLNNSFYFTKRLFFYTLKVKKSSNMAVCFCGRVIILKISWTSLNRGRCFFTCPKLVSQSLKHCGFFLQKKNQYLYFLICALEVVLFGNHRSQGVDFMDGLTHPCVQGQLQLTLVC